MKVLIENEEKPGSGVFTGHTENFLSGLVHLSGLTSDQIIEVILMENTPHALIGRTMT
ncbi:MAG: hypothetical protein NTZ52_05005 [Chlamydiae bacterium]|nr:hypothetical protein [Chlamydiota bacterium]